MVFFNITILVPWYYLYIQIFKQPLLKCQSKQVYTYTNWAIATLISFSVIIVIDVIIIVSIITIVLSHHLLDICWPTLWYFSSYLYLNYSIYIIGFFINNGIFYYQNHNYKLLETFWSINDKNSINLEGLHLLLSLLLFMVLFMIYPQIVSFISSIKIISFFIPITVINHWK